MIEPKAPDPRFRRVRHAVPFALLMPVGVAAAPSLHLEEVVVTAQRRAVPTLATPLSIGRVGGADIELDRCHPKLGGATLGVRGSHLALGMSAVRRRSIVPSTPAI